MFALMFTACDALLQPKDDGKDRFVTFTNKTAIPISLYFEGQPTVTLDRSTLSKTEQKEVTRKGFDIVLTNIVFGDSTVESDPMKYIMLEGSLVAGQQKRGKQAVGIPLAGGELIFRADPLEWSAATLGKISVIPLDD